MEQKVWWKSKTILFNLIAGMLLALSAAVPALKGWSDWISANGVLIGLVWSGLNVFLRAIHSNIVLVD